MSQLDIIRAWKDEDYRLSLSGAERALLPAHPAGLMELTPLTQEQLAAVKGGFGEWFPGFLALYGAYKFGYALGTELDEALGLSDRLANGACNLTSCNKP